MRIATYNIHGWLTIDGRPNAALVADVLARTGADVIGLNEVYHPGPLPGDGALAWLAGRLGMAYAFGACETRPFPGTGTPDNYGNALLSRLPFTAVRTGFFRPVPGKERRGFLEARIGQVAVLVTDLDHADEAVRLHQVDDLFAAVGDRPDVLVGDFNCVHPREYDGRPEAFARLAAHPLGGHMAYAPHGPAVAPRVERHGYADALVVRGVLGGNTFIPAEDPVRLDYVWVRADRVEGIGEVGIVEEPPGAEASDHRAVYADVDIGGG